MRPSFDYRNVTPRHLFGSHFGSSFSLLKVGTSRIPTRNNCDNVTPDYLNYQEDVSSAEIGRDLLETTQRNIWELKLFSFTYRSNPEFAMQEIFEIGRAHV